MTELTFTERAALGHVLNLAHHNFEAWLFCSSASLQARLADLDQSSPTGMIAGILSSADETLAAASVASERHSEIASHASMFRELGSAGEKLGFHGEAERWNALADQANGALEGARLFRTMEAAYQALRSYQSKPAAEEDVLDRETARTITQHLEGILRIAGHPVELVPCPTCEALHDPAKELDPKVSADSIYCDRCETWIKVGP